MLVKEFGQYDGLILKYIIRILENCMADENVILNEKNGITEQDPDYENDLLGLSRPAVLVSLLSERLASFLKATDE